MAGDKNIIFGKHPVLEALRAGKAFEKLLVLKTSQAPEVREICGIARKAGYPVQMVPIQKLNTITRKNHQGVIGYASLIPYYEVQDIVSQAYEQGRDPLLLVLDQVTDVRNLGSIARSAECFGVDAIVVPEKGTAMIHADAIKASAGALLNMPVCKVADLKTTLKELKLNGLKILAAEADAGKPLKELELAGPLAIILGSEGYGIEAAIQALADETFHLPMVGQTQSLNVSVTAGIILYEVLGKRQ